jgi:membrane protein implicated in regulation of membrane protease activity
VLLVPLGPLSASLDASRTVDVMSDTTFWTIALAAGLFTAAMLARYLLGRSGLRKRIHPRTVVIVAWTSTVASAVAVAAAVISGRSSIGWSAAFLVVAATMALLLHNRTRNPTDPPPEGDSNHHDHE